MIFRDSSEKYHHYEPRFRAFSVVVFWGLRRWGVVPFLALVVVFGYFSESNSFLTNLFSHERVYKKGSNTTTKTKIPPLRIFEVNR